MRSSKVTNSHWGLVLCVGVVLSKSIMYECGTELRFGGIATPKQHHTYAALAVKKSMILNKLKTQVNK